MLMSLIVSIAAVIVSLISLIISLRQNSRRVMIEGEKIKLSHFDHRLEIFDEIERAIKSWIEQNQAANVSDFNRGGLDLSARYQFPSLRRRTEFLFGPDVIENIDVIYSKLIELDSIRGRNLNVHSPGTNPDCAMGI
jgi:hypothetical protein